MIKQFYLPNENSFTYDIKGENCEVLDVIYNHTGSNEDHYQLDVLVNTSQDVMLKSKNEYKEASFTFYVTILINNQTLEYDILEISDYKIFIDGNLAFKEQIDESTLVHAEKVKFLISEV